MARELARAGVRVRVITGMPNYPDGVVPERYRGHLVYRETIDDVSILRTWLYPAGRLERIKRLANHLTFTATGGLALLASRSPDLVFVEAQPVTLALPAFALKLLRGTPYIYNTPDLQVESAAETGHAGRTLARFAEALETALMRGSLSVTTVTHAFIRHFAESRGLPLDALTFLPNGADTEALRPLPRDEDYARELGIGNRKAFTYAGTHARYHGLEVIIEAAKRLRHRDDIVIVMVGRGPERQALIDQAEREGLSNVLFKQSPFDEMAKLMSVSWGSIAVLRALGVASMMRLSKPIPALACGVPVVYAGTGESAEILEREGCGLCVEPERPELLAAAIERLADDEPLRHEMGTRGRALVEREYSWAFIVEDWLRQIRSIRAGGSPDVRGLQPVEASA